MGTTAVNLTDRRPKTSKAVQRKMCVKPIEAGQNAYSGELTPMV